jgi:hypothetical protein
LGRRVDKITISSLFLLVGKFWKYARKENMVLAATGGATIVDAFEVIASEAWITQTQMYIYIYIYIARAVYTGMGPI